MIYNVSGNMLGHHANDISSDPRDNPVGWILEEMGKNGDVGHSDSLSMHSPDI